MKEVDDQDKSQDLMKFEILQVKLKKSLRTILWINYLSIILGMIVLSVSTVEIITPLSIMHCLSGHFNITAYNNGTLLETIKLIVGILAGISGGLFASHLYRSKKGDIDE